ncbi:MAG TPA: hypothetical protein PKG52_07010 [bacterium]|nr:hypothetical protein [bacterium]HPS28941.1 hypothetical protein [bacterium]
MEERRNKPEFERSPKKWRYNFSKSLFTFWKTVKMYGGENERITEEITFFKDVLNFFFADKEELSITFDGIDIKVDKVRIRGQRQDDKYFEDVYDLLLSLCLAGITFRSGVSDKEILDFFRVIGKYPVGREPKIQAFERIKADLQDLKYIEIIPYDPEESGNLPIYTVDQSIRRIYRTLSGEYKEYKKMVDAVENIPLRTVERSSQDLITIIQNIDNANTRNLLLFLSSLPAYGGTFKGASAAARTIYSIFTSLKLDFDLNITKRTAISAYFQYFTNDLDKGYSALSRMDEFNYSRIEAAVNSAWKITDFSDDGILKSGTSSTTISGDILKVVAYYDSVTKKWPDRVGYKGPTLSRPEALRNILRNVKKGAFRKEIAEAFAGIIGIYPCGSFLKTVSTNETVVSGGRFKSYIDEAPVFVLNPDLSVKEIRIMKADNLVDIPGSGGVILPAATLAQMLSFYLKDE